MVEYATPGVYIQEVSTGPKPISMAGTSTVAFLGIAPDRKSHLQQAVACNNWSQFTRLFVKEGNADTHLSLAVFSFFENGGTRCYIVNVGNDGIATEGTRKTGVALLEAIDEIALVAAPGYSDLASQQALISHCTSMGDRFAILDAPETVEDIDALKKVASVDAGAGEGKPAAGLRCPESRYAAFYFPWVRVSAPLDRKQTVNAPPSGFMAGIYARTDASRGVHKAPANEAVLGALGLCYQVSRAEQAELNNAGVNCIRQFSDVGIRVWGARTVAADPEWRYISVRRMFLAIEESIQKGTQWVVFEPNNEMLWNAVTRDVSSFLNRLWREGALLGTTPEQAFFVKCDSETNPPEVIEAGRLEIEIGLAAVRPAEFIVFRIGQWSGGETGAESEETAAQ